MAYTRTRHKRAYAYACTHTHTHTHKHHTALVKCMHTLTHSLIMCGASEVSSNPTIHFSCAVDLGTGEPCKGRKFPCVSLSFMRRDAVTSTNDEFCPFDHSRSPACTGDSTRARRHDVYETCVHLCNYQICTRIRGMGIHFHEYKTYP